MTKTALILYTNNVPSVSGELHQLLKIFYYFSLAEPKNVSAVIFTIAIVSDQSSHSLFE